MDVIIAWLVSAALLAITLVTRPASARCPAGYDLRTGVRRDGRFACWARPVGDAGGVDGVPDQSVQSHAVLRSRVYCTGGARPIVVDFHTVGCQR